MNRNDPPKKRLITYMLEYAGIFALSAFLLRLGICYLQEIWWILLIIAGVIGISIGLYRLWRRNHW